jgi:hypothetical protein
MKKAFLFIISLTSAWCMGIGFRFLMMGTTDTYLINPFDKFFDWGILALLGLILFISTIYFTIKISNGEKE